MPGDDDDKITYIVTSNNQSGGITAGQVNVARQPRRVDERLRSELLRIIAERRDAPISVTAVLGDGEALGFAREIKGFLEDEGYKVDGVNQAVYSGPVVGQSINPEPDRLDIRIGNQQ